MLAPNDTVVAKLVPGLGGETSVINKNTDLEVEARPFYRFVDDGKYAHLIGAGIDPLTGNLFDHLQVESAQTY